MQKLRRLCLLLMLLLALTGCISAWETVLIDPEGTAMTVTRAELKEFAPFTNDDGAVPLERVLYAHGYRVIETLQVSEAESSDATFAWPAVAEAALWHRSGEVEIDGERLRPARIEGQPAEALGAVTVHLIDIAPTAAAALGLSVPSQATGRAFASPPSVDHVLLLFIDGFGYLRYEEARDAGLIPNLVALGEPQLGLAAYPPSTVVCSAAILTGAPPEVNGVVDRGTTRKTEVETLFDVAAAAGLSVVAVEGDALAFNLRNAEITLSGDRDGNGSTDDNVLANALEVLQGPMPDLLWVHFHGIDDAGHAHGPGALEEEAAIAGVDTAIGELLSTLPARTVVLIFADHGMHTVDEGERLGNHGNLIARDMLVPVWLWQTPGG
ncbi:MAG: alkaline phosphatase family protein [Anaerolineae bacterium]